MSGRERVLLCGSNYGRAYAQAVLLAPDEFQLAGLLARGSARSRRLANRLGIPLVTDPDRLPASVHLACAALGREGSEVVIRLLRQGVHVLCEHPQPPEAVREALREAEATGSRFHVNGHFADLAASRAFIGRCRQERESAEPRFVHLTLADRFLWAGLDILARALGPLGPITVDAVRRASPFTLVEGSLAEAVPAALRIQPTRRPDGRLLDVGSPEYVVCYRIEIWFPNGALTLLAGGGPVVWTANEYRIENPDAPLWDAVDVRSATGRSVLAERAELNCRALRALAGHARTGDGPSAQRPAHLLDVSVAWQTLGEAASRPDHASRPRSAPAPEAEGTA